MACGFFNAEEVAASHKTIGKRQRPAGNPKPLTGNDFLQYLEANGVYKRRPNALRVWQPLPVPSRQTGKPNHFSAAGMTARAFPASSWAFLNSPVDSAAKLNSRCAFSWTSSRLAYCDR